MSGESRVHIRSITLFNTFFQCPWLHYIYSGIYSFRLWVQIMMLIIPFLLLSYPFESHYYQL